MIFFRTKKGMAFIFGGIGTQEKCKITEVCKGVVIPSI